MTGGRPALSQRITAAAALLACAILCGAQPGGRPRRQKLPFSPRLSSHYTTIGIIGSHFTVNGKQTFLQGISYFGALGATDEVVARDLSKMKEYGFRWLRIWATWDAYDNDVSAVRGDGAPREPFLGKLKWLVAECDRLGLVVDVTLTRGGGAAPHLASAADLTRAVETVATALRPYGNCYLDLANERNVRDKRNVSFAELRQLREATRRIDPDRLVTASQGGDIGQDELHEYLVTAGVDFVCPHRPRDAASPAQTEAKTQELLGWMKQAGRVVPVHYQEPFRRGYGNWQPRAEDFAADLQAARAGGAAGWCFHNGPNAAAADGRPRRSFDLRDGSLFDQLDPEERKFLADFRTRHAKR